MIRGSQGKVETGIKTIILGRLHRPSDRSLEIEVDTPILGKGLGLDSLDALALVMAIEAEFDVLFDDDELTVDLFESVSSLIAQVEKKLCNGRGGGQPA